VLKLKDLENAKPYFVHYVGWKSRWDEWIGRDAVLGLADDTPARRGRKSKSTATVTRVSLS